MTITDAERSALHALKIRTTDMAQAASAVRKAVDGLDIAIADLFTAIAGVLKLQQHDQEDAPVTEE